MKSLSFGVFPELDYACNEAMNTLCTNLIFSGSSYKKIMITSCMPNEGKSFLAMNMLRTLAGMGKRVVLVDVDLRKSILRSRYQINDDGANLGMTNYLAGRCDVNDIFYATNIPNAYIIPSGRDVINSLPLLSTPTLGLLLDAMAESFDYVLVDVPPVGLIIDAAMIAKVCDGAILVVSDNSVSRRELSDAKNQLVKADCSILGCVLNKVTFGSRGSKKYYYKSYYQSYERHDYDVGAVPKHSAKKNARKE